jgi:hypothetical protein
MAEALQRYGCGAAPLEHVRQHRQPEVVELGNVREIDAERLARSRSGDGLLEPAHGAQIEEPVAADEDLASGSIDGHGALGVEGSPRIYSGRAVGARR